MHDCWEQYPQYSIVHEFHISYSHTEYGILAFESKINGLCFSRIFVYQQIKRDDNNNNNRLVK